MNTLPWKKDAERRHFNHIRFSGGPEPPHSFPGQPCPGHSGFRLGQSELNLMIGKPPPSACLIKDLKEDAIMRPGPLIAIYVLLLYFFLAPVVLFGISCFLTDLAVPATTRKEVCGQAWGSVSRQNLQYPTIQPFGRPGISENSGIRHNRDTVCQTMADVFYLCGTAELPGQYTTADFSFLHVRHIQQYRYFIQHHVAGKYFGYCMFLYCDSGRGQFHPFPAAGHGR